MILNKIIKYKIKYDSQKFNLLAIKHKIHPWCEIEEKIKIFFINLYFMAMIEAISEDKTNKGIINSFTNFSIINKGNTFWSVNKIRRALKLIDSLIKIIQKWKGTIPSLIKIEILIIRKKKSKLNKVYWNAAIKNKDEEKDWTIK